MKSMKAYDHLAPYYDKFMGFMEYDDEAKDLHGFLCEVDANAVLDVGVGSGGHLIPLLRNGHHIDALDISRPMLDILEGKLLSQGLNAQLYEGDMCAFRTKRQYDVIYALGDTIHHLDSVEALGAFLETSYENLKEGGYLLFTWRERSYFKDLADLGSFYETHGDDYLLWDIAYRGNRATMGYTAFINHGNDTFHRITEEHPLQVYDQKDIKTTAKKTGFSLQTELARKFLITEDDKDEFKIITLLQK